MRKDSPHGRLEMEEDLAFERLNWRLERLGWGILALLIAAFFGGALGVGPLSEAQAGQEGEGLWLNYGRFARFQAPNTLTVHVGAGAVRGGKVRLWLNRDYLEAVGLEEVTPQPERVEAYPGRLLFTFAVPEAGPSQSIAFDFQPGKPGLKTLEVGLAEGPRQRVWQLIYP